MSDETEQLDDLQKHKLKRAMAPLGTAAKGFSKAIDQANAQAHADGTSAEVVEQEIHRRGLPEWASFDILAWPFGALNFAVCHGIAAGLNAEQLRKALSLMHIEMLATFDEGADANQGDDYDAFVAELDLECDCGQYHCPRIPERIGQMRHSFMSSIVAVYNLFDAPKLTTLDRDKSTPEQIAAWNLTYKTLADQHKLDCLAKTESILEFCLAMLIESGMANAFK